MKKITILLVALTGCGHRQIVTTTQKPKRQINIAWTDSVSLVKGQDEAVSCLYVGKRDVLVCMSPAEFAIRYPQKDE